MAEFVLPNENMAARLSELLYTLTYPDGAEVTGKYLFGWENRNGQTVMVFPDDFETAIFVKDNFAAVIEEIGQILNGNLPADEGAALVAYMKTGRVMLRNLIPASMEQVLLAIPLLVSIW